MPEPTKPSRQGRAYSKEEVEALLGGALDELMADGTPLRDLSVERLIGRAGIARSTFYKYFDDKSSMLRALSAGALRRLYDAQRHWITRGAEVRQEDVRAGMDLLLEAYRADEVIMRAVGEASLYDVSIREAYLDAVDDYARAIERLVRRGQRAGTIPRDLPPAETADALAWMAERTLSRSDAMSTEAGRARLAEALTRIVCVTLRTS